MCLRVVSSDSLISFSRALAILTNIASVSKHVEPVFLLISRALVEPEQDTTDKRQASNDSVVPNQQRVL